MPIAVVTGGSRGIGLAAVKQLERDGFTVVVADLNPPAGGIRADIGDRKSVEALFSEVLSKYGRVDALVNNAALSIRTPFLEAKVEDVERILAVTLMGAFHCTQLAARAMVAQGDGGSIVTVSSVHAERGYANSTAYNAAKAGVTHMSRTWATELAPHRIRVNCVAPGWTDTPGERSYFTEEQIREQGAKLPWGRLATPEEIADAIGFLISPRASYITGTVLKVDGGITLP